MSLARPPEEVIDLGLAWGLEDFSEPWLALCSRRGAALLSALERCRDEQVSTASSTPGSSTATAAHLPVNCNHRNIPAVKIQQYHLPLGDLTLRVHRSKNITAEVLTDMCAPLIFLRHAVPSWCCFPWHLCLLPASQRSRLLCLPSALCYWPRRHRGHQGDKQQHLVMCRTRHVCRI
jgi:hypothetical protein